VIQNSSSFQIAILGKGSDVAYLLDFIT